MEWVFCGAVHGVTVLGAGPFFGRFLLQCTFFVAVARGGWVPADAISGPSMWALFSDTVCFRTWPLGVLPAVVGVNAGLLLRTLARVICWQYFFRSHSGGVLGAELVQWSRVSAGLLLLTLARVVCELYFLSLLATVRGGTSFLCPTATKKRSKENAFPQTVLSVPSVQATAFGSRVERCSQNHGHLKPSFSRILTSPRFATSALGQVRYAHRPGTASPLFKVD